MRFKSTSIVGLAIVLSLVGCGQRTVNSAVKKSSEAAVVDIQKDPVAFLKWSMDQHAALIAFSAIVDWTMSMPSGPAKPMNMKRTIQFVKPNKFKLVSHGELTLTTVCDGTEMVEYSSTTDLGAMKIEVPPDIAHSRSMQMNHFMFNGTLLYKFFGGSSNYDSLVDASAVKVSFGSDQKSSSGEPLATVKFYAASNYGNVVALISRKSGLVHRLTYDIEGVQRMAAQSGQTPQAVSCSEVFSNWVIDKPAPDSEFSTALPSGMKLAEVPTSSGSEDGSGPPFPIGSVAPDVELTGLDGKKSKLSDFRGSIVLIDFWATWCGPCIEGLPVTNKLHEELKSKGLKVIAVSDEDEKTISAFLKDKGFSFTVLRDAQGKANAAFKVDAIPTMVILDRQGKLLNYSVGLEPEGTIRENLKKAGVKF